MHTHRAGTLTEDDEGYHYEYETTYLMKKNAEAISLTLPLTAEKYFSKVLFSFFDGLIPEGWQLEIVKRNWKLDERDRMGILLVACRDCIGAVSVEPIENEADET